MEDTGAGIAPEEIGHIFQAFNQSETGRQSKQGTGLGLPISRKFVELMGGKLTVESQVDRGSIFRFNIIADPIENKNQQLAVSKLVTALAPSQSKYRILIVDDVWQSRLLIIKLLGQIGFEVREAENGQQALELARQWQPHLIFMDMRMPVMDGYESTMKIREAEKSQNNSTVPMKIVALTASAFESKRSQTIAAGCDDYLRKPFKEDRLLAKIQEHLGVEYIYQEDSLNSETEQSPKRQFTPLTAESLKIMPETWLQEFKLAAEELDETKLIDAIALIPPQGDLLKASLMDLVENFQFETIVKLID